MKDEIAVPKCTKGVIGLCNPTEDQKKGSCGVDAYTVLPPPDYNGLSWEEPRWVVTEDGYILQLYRAFWNDSSTKSSDMYKTPILWGHALTTDYNMWFLPPNSDWSIMYDICKQGYDCWFTNWRGSVYSKGHVNKDISHKDYFDYSGWQEMGQKDLPAIYKAIATVKWENENYDYPPLDTNKYVNEDQRIIYVGESKGTSAGWVGMSETDTLSETDLRKTNEFMRERTRKFVSMDAPTYMYNPGSKLWYVSLLRYPIRAFADPITGGSLFHNDCAKGSIFDWTDTFNELCQKFKLCSFSDFEMDMNPVTQTDEFGWNLPLSGVSVKSIYHFAQLIVGGTQFPKGRVFKKYDYGSDQANIDHYKQKTPPAWSQEGYNVETLFISGGKDTTTPPEGTDYHIEEIRKNANPPELRCYRNDDGWHGQPIISKDVNYRDIMTRFINGTLEENDAPCPKTQ